MNEDMQARAGLYQKIHQVMQAMGRIEKRGRNTHQNYEYVMAADVIHAARELFVEHGLVLLPSVQGCEYVRFEKEGKAPDYRARISIAYTIADIDTGAEVRLTFQGEGMDSGDKAVYKAYTGCFKYFLIDTFLIPTGDDPEADGETAPQPRQQPQQPQPQRAPAQSAARPANQGGGEDCRTCGTPKIQSPRTGNWYCRPCLDEKNAAVGR